MTIRARMLVAIAAIVVPCVLLFVHLTRNARSDARLEASYAAILAQMDDGGRERCELDPTRFVRRSRRPRGRRGAGGGLPGPMHAYDATLAPTSMRAPALPATFAREDGSFAREVTGRRSGLLFYMPWDDGPCARIFVEGPPDAPRAHIAQLALPLGVLGLALFGAFLSLGAPVGRLRALAALVRSGAAIDREAQLLAPRDEVGELARSIEASQRQDRERVATLEARERALRDYVAGTTHDLAIPITVLSGRLSDGERSLDDHQATRANLRAALAECEYLAQLVANLGAASRLVGEEMRTAKIDLAAIVERVALRHAPLAKAAGLELAHAVPDQPLHATGDDLLVERALSNLVHNAIRHHPPGGGHVAITLDVRNGRFVLRVADDGSISAEALARLSSGKPDDQARTRGRGLGFGIVRSVAALHRFDLAIDRDDSGGLSVSLEGPVAR